MDVEFIVVVLFSVFSLLILGLLFFVVFYFCHIRFLLHAKECLKNEWRDAGSPSPWGIVWRFDSILHNKKIRMLFKNNERDARARWAFFSLYGTIIILVTVFVIWIPVQIYILKKPDVRDDLAQALSNYISECSGQAFEFCIRYKD